MGRTVQVAKDGLQVFDDLVDLADSGLTEGRVRDDWFGRGKVWSQHSVADRPDVLVFSRPGHSWVYAVDKLRTDERLRKSIKVTAALRMLPKVGERVSVSFKSEDEQRGQAVGPVTVVDHEVYDQDELVVKAQTEKRLGLPFGYKPQGQHELGWLTLARARRVAQHYGVELEEY